MTRMVSPDVSLRCDGDCPRGLSRQLYHIIVIRVTLKLMMKACRNTNYWSEYNVRPFYMIKQIKTKMSMIRGYLSPYLSGVLKDTHSFL